MLQIHTAIPICIIFINYAALFDGIIAVNFARNNLFHNLFNPICYLYNMV